MRIEMPSEFTLDDLLALVSGKEGDGIPEGYYTTRQWSEWAGLSQTHMSNILNRAFNAGVLDCKRVPQMCRDAIVRTVPAYKFLFEKEG